MTFSQFQVQHGDCAKYCSSRRCIDRPCIQNVANESLKINLKQNFILLTDILLSYTLKLNTLIYDMDSLSLNVGDCRQLSRCSACLIWIEKSKFEFWLPHLGFVRGWCCSPQPFCRACYLHWRWMRYWRVTLQFTAPWSGILIRRLAATGGEVENLTNE